MGVGGGGIFFMSSLTFRNRFCFQVVLLQAEERAELLCFLIKSLSLSLSVCLSDK